MPDDKSHSIKSPISDVRVPPQSLEAEKALLGSIMLRPEAINDVLDMARPEAFYAEKHRLVYATMLELFSKSSPIDLLSLSSRLKEKDLISRVGGSSYLSELVNIVPSAANILHYAEIVQKKFMMRSLIHAANHINQLGYDEAEELDEILDKAEKKIYEVTNLFNTNSFVSLSDELHEAFERLEHLNKEEGLRGVPTGFPTLDNKLSGLQESDLVILAARPSMGKTALALDIARQTACHHDNAVLIFSLEMASQQLVDRMLAAESRVDSWKLRTGKVRAEAEFAKLRDALDRLSNAPIYIDDQPGNTILKMRSVARRIKRDKNLKLIIVDYLQLMLPSGRFKNSDSMVQQVTEISRSLKILARELKIPVLALSQLSRAVESRGGKPRLSDLRDSGCLAGDTLITRADTGERVPIKELAGKSNIPVLSFDNNHTIVEQTISKVFSSGVKALYRIQTASGRSIKASGNHPFYTIAGWKRIDKLETGQHLGIPRTCEVTPHSSLFSDDEIILLAHLIGDGCILPRQPYHYTSADRKNLDVVEKTAKKLFGIKPRRVKQKNWWHVYLPSPYHLTRGKLHPITHWFKDMGMRRVRSYNKYLPPHLFKNNGRKIALFLHHLWATDGNISIKRIKGRKPSASIYYATTSKRLAKDVQHLLLRLGIMSSIRTARKKGYRSSYHVHIEGSVMQLAFCRTVGCHGKRGNIIPKLIQLLEHISPNPNTGAFPVGAWKIYIEPAKERAGISWREFADRMGVAYNGTAVRQSGVSRTRLAAIAAALEDDGLETLSRSDLFWDKIISIEQLGKEEVFDATVPGTHSFIANDFIVHNSIEQDADVVMFIHREDKYKEDSDKPNIAEILIEKHRNGPVGKAELYFDEERASFLNIDRDDYHKLAAEDAAEDTPDF